MYINVSSVAPPQHVDAVKLPIMEKFPCSWVSCCVKLMRAVSSTLRCDAKPIMLKSISLVVRDPHVTAFVTVAVEATNVPPEVTDDALRGRIQCHRAVWCVSGSELYVRGIELNMTCQTRRREI